MISRHLAQLRKAGLIEEHSPDNRNITYSVRDAPIADLSASIATYIERDLHK